MNEFIVWGAGNRGKDVINAIGRERIAAVVDSNSEKWGSDLWGISIISPHCFSDNYRNNVVIITPENHENEILDEIFDMGIYSALVYDADFHAVETYMRQVEKDKLFSQYEKDCAHYIYGLSLLGVLAYQDFVSRGFSCQMVLQKELDERIASAVIRALDIKVCSKPENGTIHLTATLKSDDDLDYFDSLLTLCDGDYFENTELHKFKNNSVGKRCFIVGTGPSLKMSDLEVLHKNNEICIGVNGIYKSFEFTSWRPNYYMVEDLDAVFFGRQSIIEMNVDAKFVADVSWSFDGLPGFYKWHLDRRWDLHKRPKFSDDFSKRSYAGLTITYDGALQLAAYMGFNEIYLLGIDCSNNASNKTSHFFDAYGKENKKETGSLQVDANILAFESAREYAEQNGFKIYNATRGGALEVFERRDFDSLFE